MLEINNLTHIYKDGKVGCKNVNIKIEDGDIYGFIGPNGSGKSTTIKSVVGILPFTSGEVLINGKSIKNDPLACKRDFAYIPDNPDLYESLTGIQYINFICDIFKVTNREEEINKYADIFEIRNDLTKPIKAYSHGMRQKLAIISALVHHPKLIIMDEPFVGLDPKATFQIKEIMRQEAQKGVSFFFSSHVLEVVEKLCNKIAIIKNGEIIKQGIVDEIKGESSLEDEFMEIMK